MIHEHTATDFEDFCRSRYPEAARYWEGSLEFDFVRPGEPGQLIVTEVKWRRLSEMERPQLESRLKENWHKSKLSCQYPVVRFEVLDATVLETGA